MKALSSKKHFIVISLIMILSFHFINNFIWLAIDDTPDGVDTAWHLIEAAKFQILFRGISESKQSLFSKIKQMFYTFREGSGHIAWPPLIYLISWLLVPSHFSLFSIRLYVDFLFFSLLIISVYFLGKKIFNKKTGLLAAFLISFYPSVYFSSRQFGLDLPLTTFTALCTCFILYSESFSRRGYSLLFGLSLGLATWAKLQIAFFLLVPLCWETFKIFSKAVEKKSKSLFNLILSLAVTFILFWVYWGSKLQSAWVSFCEYATFLYPSFKNNLFILSEPEIPIFSISNMFFYPSQMLNYTSWVLFALFVIALILSWRYKMKRRGFFLASLIVPYLIYTFISMKWARYTLPFLVFIALISAWSIDSLRRKYLKKFMLRGIIIYCLGVFFIISWVIPYNKTPFFCGDFFGYHLPYFRPPAFDAYAETVSEKGIINDIKGKISGSEEVTISYNNHGARTVLVFYDIFSDYILSGKINLRRDDELSFSDADYIVLGNQDWFEKKDILKKYKVLSKLKEETVLFKE
ncbi:MAG: glycosyltransferase family 39 protein [Candidatus Omnitrophica bacterium]|nr:glycosyltransferase family 39 protein [Candidatus Omnitrophota bacterium]